MEGKIIATIFPQDSEKKLRPALVLREFPGYVDVLICGITSKLYQYIEGFDLLLDTEHPDFKNSGLRKPGVCRLNMLTMLPKEQVNGSLGAVSKETHFLLLKTLTDYLLKQ